nr:hypothetical protein [Streptomyces roseoverticillatus]
MTATEAVEGIPAVVVLPGGGEVRRRAGQLRQPLPRQVAGAQHRGVAGIYDVPALDERFSCTGQTVRDAGRHELHLDAVPVGVLDGGTQLLAKIVTVLRAGYVRVSGGRSTPLRNT